MNTQIDVYACVCKLSIDTIPTVNKTTNVTARFVKIRLCITRHKYYFFGMIKPHEKYGEPRTLRAIIIGPLTKMIGRTPIAIPTVARVGSYRKCKHKSVLIGSKNANRERFLHD